MTTFASLTDAIGDWTGLEHVFFVHSGSAALSLALAATGSAAAKGQVALPAVACWTLTQSILEAGLRPHFVDVNDSLAAPADGLTAAGTGLAITVAPWGEVCKVPGEKPGLDIVTIADLTLSPASASEAVTANAAFAILSLGRGKPWDVGAGGILACGDEALAVEVQDRLQFGRRCLRWQHRGPRFVASTALAEQARDAWYELIGRREAHIAARLVWEVSAASLPLRPVPLAEPLRAGVTAMVPHLLDEDFGLTAEDLHRVAVAEQMPIGVLPVSPAYREPAGCDLTGDCPHAEALIERLVFLPASALAPAFIPKLAAFLHAVHARAPELQYPFKLASPSQPAAVPERYLRWVEYGLLCRGLDGGFRVLDTLWTRIYAVDDHTATALQAAQAESIRMKLAS